MTAVEKMLSNLPATRKRGPRNLAAANQYRAQWVYYTPPGYRDDPFDVPFSFTVPQDGNQHQNFPVQLDDDAPFIVRGFFGNAGPTSLATNGFATIWDANAPANALSVGLAYNYGGWGFSPFSWPVEPELYCQAGAVLMIDFEITNSGGTSSLQGCFMGVKRRKEC